jgi:hypothetical protein
MKINWKLGWRQQQQRQQQIFHANQ